MISKNDLYDISFALVNIRNDIQCINNTEIITQIDEVLNKSDNYYEDNQIRKAISSIEDLDKEKWYYTYHNNIYLKHQLLKNDDIYIMLKNICSLLKHLINQHNYNKAYDLVDSIHCLPEILADNNFIIPKSYWKTHIKEYRNKWDKSFLKEDEKVLKKSNIIR